MTSTSIALFTRANLNAILLRNANCYARDETAVTTLLKKFCSEGPSKLCVISDFDRTITTGNSTSAHGVVEAFECLGLEFRATAEDLYQKYFAIEIDPYLTVEEKLPHMRMWYKLNHENMINNAVLTKSHIYDQALSPAVEFREGSKSFLHRCESAKVPVLVFSAGLKDVIVKVSEPRAKRAQRELDLISNRHDSSNTLCRF